VCEFAIFCLRRACRHPSGTAPAAWGLGLWLWAVAAGALAATGNPNEKAPPTTIYHCDVKGGSVYSDTPQRCADGQIAVAPVKAASGVVSVARINRAGPPCPLPAIDPEGPIWAGLRVCYARYLRTQKNEGADEAQLAGAVMGSCDLETRRLVNGRSYRDELGPNPPERRLAVKRWAQWLVRSLGKAANPVPVDVVKAGKSQAIARLNGPLEVQLDSGELAEALNGTVVEPGEQLFVRRGTSFMLGGTAVGANASKDRCVRLD
jgi:hypothetical protein